MPRSPSREEELQREREELAIRLNFDPFVGNRGGGGAPLVRLGQRPRRVPLVSGATLNLVAPQRDERGKTIADLSDVFSQQRKPDVQPLSPEHRRFPTSRLRSGKPAHPQGG